MSDPTPPRHPHHHHSHHHDPASRNIGLALALNLGFALVELVGGLWTGSLAILSDALHDAGDALALGLSWFLERKAKQGSDQHYSYGYRRFSLLGALINAMILAGGSIWILTEALQRLQDPVQPYAPGMLGLAVLGVLVNGAGFFKLKNTDSLNQKMVSLHLLEDLFGWVALLVVSGVMMVWDLPILDPLFSILFSAFLLVQVFRALRSTLRILLMKTPEGISLAELQGQILATPGITALHDTHLWTMDGNYHVLTCHLVVPNHSSEKEHKDLKTQIKQLVAQLGIDHATLEIELEEEECPQGDCGALSL
ncbi:MAG: cation diffusion facilitator family transporter [bacterium]|nr:cation diffusion facilitator family transporter [bacterium]